MKKFKSNTKGQFVVIAALLVAVLTLAVAASIYELSSHRRELSYKPVNELVLGVASDLDRALTYALSNATKEYYANLRIYRDVDYSRQRGNLSGALVVSKWQRSVLASYPQLGLDINFLEAPSFTFQWDTLNSGLSQASIPSYELDIVAYGFKGWTGRASKYVRLAISEFVFNNNSYSEMKFQIKQSTTDESNAPIPNLTLDDITISAQISQSAWLFGTPRTLQYLGEGSYNLIFQNPTSAYPMATRLMVKTPEDEILVSAFTSSSVSVHIQSQKLGENSPDNAPTIPVRIKLGSVTYWPLPQIITSWEALQPGLECDFNGDMNYIFVRWDCTGDVVIANPSHRETMVTHYGNATITAVYDTLVSTSSAYSLTVTSRLDGSGVTNAGSIVFDGTPHSTLPVGFDPLMSQDHNIIFNPQSGYTFACWEFTPISPTWITMSDEHSSSTNIRLFGNGTLTAVYHQRTIVLDSDEYNGTSSHLGTMTFNGISYGNLPSTLATSNATVSNGQYTLQYTPSNASYSFMWWELSGDIILKGPNSDTTTVEVHSNGIIKAIYAYMVDIPTPHTIAGTFFVNSHGSKDFWLVPVPPEDHGHLASKASTGSGKATLKVTSDPITDSILCSHIVGVTAYIGVDPSNAPLRVLEFELNFVYNGILYRLGYWRFTIKDVPNSRYDLTADISNANFPGDKYVIPAGSRIILAVVATFTTPPGGTIKLFYGPDMPSCVTLN